MSVNAPSIDEALAQYDRESARDVLIEAERERQTVLAKFPLDQWPTLSLDQYALGQGNDDTFCWWMEWGAKTMCSMRGGSADKHLVYKRKEDGNWRFDKRYKNTQEAWEAVRAGFVEAFEKARAQDWTGIDAIESFGSATALRTKALYCYFPNDILPVLTGHHVRHFLAALGSDAADAGKWDVARLDNALLEILRGKPSFDGWSPLEMMKFLYHWMDPRDQRTALKIAPGRDAVYWPDCLAGQFIRVGWDDVGDLRKYDSFEPFHAAFKEKYTGFYEGNQSTVTKKAKELWSIRDVELGDLIVANKGTSHVLAVGTVVEPGYDWSDGHPEFRHLVRVKWDESYARDIAPQKRWAMTTVLPVPQTLLSEIMSDVAGSTASTTTTKRPPAPPVDPVYAEIADALERKGQAILYGPPGTGKTYTTRAFAVWWLQRRLASEAISPLASCSPAFLQAEQRLSASQVGQKAWWVVASPKEWSWDRLAQERTVTFEYGRLRRNYPLVRKGDLVLGYQSTPDKRLVALARVGRELFTDKDGKPKIELEPVAAVSNGLTYDELRQDETLRESEPMRNRCQGTLFALTDAEFDHVSSLLIDRNPELRAHLEATGGVGPLTRLTFHPSYSYEDFIEGFRPVDARGGNLALRLEDGVFKRVCREAQANPTQTYLVMIDEINRANVAKVFGEIITLLEKDKRGLQVSLPQSREPFNIPPNVFVLGTMNTADRSIKLLDAALRRRFAFIELMPDSELLAGGQVGNLALDDFLDRLNERIAARAGREKQIGHSFLMEGNTAISEPGEFARRFRQEVLPLLQEYCYEDYAVLADYIGETLVNRKAQTLNQAVLGDADQLVAALAAEFNVTDPVVS